MSVFTFFSMFFFFNDTATTEIYTLSLHDALPISGSAARPPGCRSGRPREKAPGPRRGLRSEEHTSELPSHHDLVCRLLLEKKKENANRRLLLRIFVPTRDDLVHASRMSRRRGPRMRSRIVFDIEPLSSPFFFFFNDTATTEIYTLSLHDALPIHALAALLLAIPLGAIGLVLAVA